MGSNRSISLTRKLCLYVHTLRHLTFRQIFYQAWYPVRDSVTSHARFYRHHRRDHPSITLKKRTLKPALTKKTTFTPPATFTFLNQTKHFEDSIDWNYSGYGKLWTYHLTCFDYLNQENLPADDGMKLIKDFIRLMPGLRDAREPYPISLRLINWLKFLYRHDIDDPGINAFMSAELHTLNRRLEYHLMANHLLENAFAMTIGGYCLQHAPLYQKGLRLLMEQLEEQILDDGAHYEKSPMYHQLLLDRLLDVIHFTGSNADPKLIDAAAGMLGWLQEMTFADGSTPCFNDAAPGEAPSTSELVKYAKRLGIGAEGAGLTDSGYRAFRSRNFEMVMDGGGISPSYQPGHSHNDAGSFVLHIHGKPFLIDTAVSTYEANERRHYERSVRAHNTTHPEGVEPSGLWGSFRIGHRENVTISSESKSEIRIVRDSPLYAPCRIRRTVSCDEENITLTDEIKGPCNRGPFLAHFHFSPGINADLRDNTIETVETTLQFEHHSNLQLQDCHIASGFNKLEKSVKIVATFQDRLKTRIRIKNR